MASNAAPERRAPAVTTEEVQTLLAIHSTVTTAFDAGERPDLGKIALLGTSLASRDAKRLKQQLFDLAEGAGNLPKLAETWTDAQRDARRAKADADSLQASVKYAASRLGRGGDAARTEFNDLINNRIPNAQRYESEAGERAFNAQIKVATELKRLKAEADSIKTEIDGLRANAKGS